MVYGCLDFADYAKIPRVKGYRFLFNVQRRNVDVRRFFQRKYFLLPLTLDVRFSGNRRVLINTRREQKHAAIGIVRRLVSQKMFDAKLGCFPVIPLDHFGMVGDPVDTVVLIGFVLRQRRVQDTLLAGGCGTLA